jgi:hypothetical protein
MTPSLTQATGRLNKAALDLQSHAMFVESGMGDTPLQNYVNTLLQPSMVNGPDGLSVVLLGLSANAVAKTLSLWLNGDYFSCRALIPARSACFELTAASSSAWVLSTAGSMNSFDSLPSLAGSLENFERTATERRAPLERPQIQVPAPNGCAGLRIFIPASNETLRKNGALASWIGDQASLVVLTGHADDTLDAASIEALQPVLSAVGALRYICLSPVESGEPGWTRMLNASLMLPPLHLVESDPTAFAGGPLEIALLREFGRMKRLEGSCQMLNDAFAAETTSAQNRKRLIDPARSGSPVSSPDANPRTVSEKMMKPFLRDLEEIRKNRDDEAARSIGPEGDLYNAAQRLVDGTTFEDLRQEMLNHTIRLSLSAATLDRLRSIVRREMNRNLRDDVSLLNEAIQSGIEPLEKTLAESTGLTYRIQPPEPDVERLCESLAAQIQLNIRYKGEIPRATWKTRVQGARNWMMGVSMFLMLSSGLGVLFGREVQTLVRSTLLILMLGAFVLGLFAAIFGYKKVRAEAIEREMDKLHDAVMQELSRLFQNLLGEKRRILTEHLQRIQREVESEVARIHQSMSDSARMETERNRAAATEKARIFDNHLRTVAQSQQACRQILSELAQVQIQLGQVFVEAQRAKTLAPPPTSAVPSYQRPAIPPSGPVRQPLPSTQPVIPPASAPSPLDQFIPPQAVPQNFS